VYFVCMQCAIIGFLCMGLLTIDHCHLLLCKFGTGIWDYNRLHLGFSKELLIKL